MDEEKTINKIAKYYGWSRLPKKQTPPPPKKKNQLL